MRRSPIVLLSAAMLASGCLVPKKKLDDKQLETDACYKALQDENSKKKELAAATDELKAKLNEMDEALAEEKGKGGAEAAKLEALEKELQTKADEVGKLQTEKEELAKKSATYDSLVSSLQKEIDEGKIKITEAKNRLSVQLIDKVVFDSGSTEIKPEGEAALKKVAEVLRGVNDKQVLVEGHTDDVPLKANARFPTNWELSAARATTVVRLLQDQGVDPAHLGAAGYAYYRPVASNETDEGRHANRRIEIVLTPLESRTAAAPASGGTK